MKQIIKDVLDDMSHSQVNLGSDAARNMVSTLISAALKTKGTYTEYGDDEIEEQNARATWVCSICGENTFEVDSDYIGTGTNHLGCEMKTWDEIKDHVNEKDDLGKRYPAGNAPPNTSKVDSFSSQKHLDNSLEQQKEYERHLNRWAEEAADNDDDGALEKIQKLMDDNKKEQERLDDSGGITYRENEPELKFDPITEELYTDEPHEELPFREKNWLQKKHENKVFGGDTGIDADFGRDLGGIKGGIKKEDLQKQIYNEMTSDGLPEGGDVQAVLESHKLADEIVDNKDEKWIYESPDGGETVFRRPFSDYDPSKKEEIDWKTKKPTGRKFTEYNNGNWRSEDER